MLCNHNRVLLFFLFLRIKNRQKLCNRSFSKETAQGFWIVPRNEVCLPFRGSILKLCAVSLKKYFCTYIYLYKRISFTECNSCLNIFLKLMHIMKLCTHINKEVLHFGIVQIRSRACVMDDFLLMLSHFREIMSEYN